MSVAPPHTEHLPSKEAFVLQGHEGAVLTGRFNSQGTYCLTGGKDRTVRLWNPHKGICVKTYAGHGYEVRDVAVSKDNSKFSSCGGDKQLFLWDVGSGVCIRKFRGHDGTINAVRYTADDQVLFTAGYDQSVRAWDCRSRSLEAIQVMRPFKDSVSSLAVRGAEVVAGSVDGTVRRFDVRMGRCYVDELRHPVTAVAISHDGLCVLAACLDSTLRLLDKASGELLASYSGHVHTNVKMDCMLTPSDAYVVGSSEDGHILYWDLVEAACALRFHAHTGVVCSLDMHPLGGTGGTRPLLLTTSVDGTARVWA